MGQSHMGFLKRRCEPVRSFCRRYNTQSWMAQVGQYEMRDGIKFAKRRPISA